MSFHTVLPGSSALRGHGAGALVAQLRAVDPAVTAVQASYFYVVASGHRASGDDLRRLQALLDEHPDALSRDDSLLSIYVTARLGTLSAWSSKATDIAHNCGMSGIERIERGVHYRIGRKGG